MPIDPAKKKIRFFDEIQKLCFCPGVLVLPRFTQASRDSTERKYGKNSLE